MQNVIDIITAPSAVFARLKEQPSFWWVLLLLILLTASLQIGYFTFNDEGYLRDQMIEQAIGSRDVTAEQQKQIENSIDNMSLTTMATLAAVGTCIVVPAITALTALYLSFMSKFSANQLGFTHFFSLVCWTAVPTLLALAASWLVLLTDTNGQVSAAGLQPLSITGLLGIQTKSQVLQQFTLMHLWSLVLLTLGYQQWTKQSLGAAFAITWAPSILIYGGLVLFTL
jgi:hypothetical protein